MQLRSKSFSDASTLPGELCFAVTDARKHIALSDNRNPQLSWSDAPTETRSFALICHDPDVPSRGDDVNQEGREVPASLPRVNFFHWVLWDIPARVHEIAAGSHSNGVIAHGKPGPNAAGGMRHGLNDYTGWFAKDPNMQGRYYGYDGPCPPWNDSLLHHYVFTLYALDVAELKINGELTGANVRSALSGHVLAEAQLIGTYSLNPRFSRS